jgi:hypothetical protein
MRDPNDELTTENPDAPVETSAPADAAAKDDGKVSDAELDAAARWGFVMEE